MSDEVWLVVNLCLLAYFGGATAVALSKQDWIGAIIWLFGAVISANIVAGMVLA